MLRDPLDNTIYLKNRFGIFQELRARLSDHGMSHPPQRLATASVLVTLALLQQSIAIAPLARAVADTFANGPEAAYIQLPIDLGIEVPPFGLMTRRNMVLTPVAQRLVELILAAEVFRAS